MEIHHCIKRHESIDWRNYMKSKHCTAYKDKNKQRREIRRACLKTSNRKQRSEHSSDINATILRAHQLAHKLLWQEARRLLNEGFDDCVRQGKTANAADFWDVRLVAAKNVTNQLGFDFFGHDHCAACTYEHIKSRAIHNCDDYDYDDGICNDTCPIDWEKALGVSKERLGDAPCMSRNSPYKQFRDSLTEVKLDRQKINNLLLKIEELPWKYST